MKPISTVCGRSYLRKGLNLESVNQFYHKSEESLLGLMNHLPMPTLMRIQRICTEEYSRQEGEIERRYNSPTFALYSSKVELAATWEPYP